MSANQKEIKQGTQSKSIPPPHTLPHIHSAQRPFQLYNIANNQANIKSQPKISTNRKDKGHDETSVWSTSLTRLQTTNRLLPITQTHPTIAPLRVQNTQQPFQRESQWGQIIELQRGVVTGQHSTLEKAVGDKYIDRARPLERGTFTKRTP